MNAIETYQAWLQSPALNTEEKEELEGLAGKRIEIENRFFAPLEFGTAGLRGVVATGLHNMNRHVVRHTTQAFASLILSEGRQAAERGVAVCYDCRHNSWEFAKEAACVLAGNSIFVRLFEGMRPTPELSFAIREYNCIAGINITASHNPKQYNGYKVYWEDGAQLPPQHADVISKECLKMPMFKGVAHMDYDTAISSGRIVMMGKETDTAFLDMALCQSISRQAVEKMSHTFNIVYTPFHGAGHELVPKVLRRLGFRHIVPVPEQMEPNGDFPTVKSPNPEEKESFRLAIKLAEATNAGLIIGTDPDADRVGILVRSQKGEYTPITGNQTGVLLLDYIIKGRKKNKSMPLRPALIKTIVTSELAKAVAEKNGVACFDTFTGFKFMAEKIKEFEETGAFNYILAFEESYGYLMGNHARDKDAVTASVMIAEMAAYHAENGNTLLDVLDDLYSEYGYYMEDTINLVMPGAGGLEKMNALMEHLRNEPPENISGAEVTVMRDYLRGESYNIQNGSICTLDIKGSNVLAYDLADGTQFIIRPSGTEPKIKVYIKARGKDKADCADKISSYHLYAQDLKQPSGC
ncbi:MAG: phospho-sugar mutase [Oscillospiraceae bacterium]|nr:phospho-sugar mutase [Oscillospiraceae bacterium]